MAPDEREELFKIGRGVGSNNAELAALAVAVRDKNVGLVAKVGALQRQVAALAQAGGVDMAVLTEAAEAGARAALADLRIVSGGE